MFSIKKVQLDVDYPGGYLRDVAKTLNLPLGEQLGEGCYGVVFEHSSKKDRVVKISGADDNGYQSYIRSLSNMVFDHENLPVVYSATEYVFRNEGDFRSPNSWDFERRKVTVLVVELERLTPVHSTEDRISANFARDVAEYCRGRSKRFDDMEEAGPVRFLKKFLNDIKDRFQGIRFDLHEGNVMLRDGMTPVITDPFA